MTTSPPIVVNGDLGSGKTTVSEELAQRLDIKRICVGDLYREMARRRGMTNLQLNLHAQLDDEVDAYVDRLQSEIARSGERLVVDSRLAWHFFPGAFKVHLIADPVVAAQRVMSRPASAVESYASVDEAIKRLRERSDSERLRFVTRYGVDKTRLRNYSLVCDTTSATPEEVIGCITRCYADFADGRIGTEDTPLLFLDPRRIHPTAPDDPDTAPQRPILAGYTGTRFFLVDGRRRVSEALRRGHSLIAARLAAEAEEVVDGGLTAAEYFASRVDPRLVADWESAHDTTFYLSDEP
ncbi:AAA family ATPase [Virgisporangium aurantiacum]|uniref:Cytidylate kinase n=1 Tax=Virgisporangium aurantiacum TaxID=175570 RepID=A0A8J3ZDY2_9ACTN|nr:AAA family ATPase [Virgisporangium aurantiacum]GIJ62237.1 hypothetical protein Vau01_097530 [Virgisporangium aurantiacum]